MSYLFVYLIPQAWFDLPRDAYFVTYTCFESDAEDAPRSPSCSERLYL